MRWQPPPAHLLTVESPHDIRRFQPFDEKYPHRATSRLSPTEGRNRRTLSGSSNHKNQRAREHSCAEAGLVLLLRSSFFQCTRRAVRPGKQNKNEFKRADSLQYNIRPSKCKNIQKDSKEQKKIIGRLPASDDGPWTLYSGGAKSPERRTKRKTARYRPAPQHGTGSP